MYKLLSSKVLLFAILLISFFGMNLEEGKADCPAGYYQMSVSFPVDTCTYTANICYKCAPNGYGDNTFIIEEHFPNDTSCISSFSTDSINKVLINFLKRNENYNLLFILCGLNPCSSGDSLIIQILTPACWNKLKYPNGIIRTTACDKTEGCVERYKVCLNNQGRIIWTHIEGPKPSNPWSLPACHGVTEPSNNTLNIMIPSPCYFSAPCY